MEPSGQLHTFSHFIKQWQKGAENPDTEKISDFSHLSTLLEALDHAQDDSLSQRELQSNLKLAQDDLERVIRLGVSYDLLKCKPNQRESNCIELSPGGKRFLELGGN